MQSKHIIWTCATKRTHCCRSYNPNCTDLSLYLHHQDPLQVQLLLLVSQRTSPRQQWQMRWQRTTIRLSRYSIGRLFSSHFIQAKRYAKLLQVTGRAVFSAEGGPTMPLQATRFTFHLFNSADDVPTLVSNFAKVVRSLM